MIRLRGAHKTDAIDYEAVAELNPHFDPHLSFAFTEKEFELRHDEIFQDAEPTGFIEWLNKQRLNVLLEDMVADLVSWFEMRENDEIGVPEFSQPSIASMYFIEHKSIGFLALQLRKERTSMYRLPLTRNEWADFISMVNERDLDTYDRLLDYIIEKTGFAYWVKVAPCKWYQRQKSDNSMLVRQAAELLLMIRLGFEKGRSRPDLRPNVSEFVGRDASVYGLPSIDIDLDIIGRMFVTFPYQAEIQMDITGNFEEEIKRYILQTIDGLGARQVKEFSDSQKIKKALKDRGHDPATLPNYKQAIAFPKILPLENRKIVRLEDYLEYGFGMNKQATGTAFEDFIDQLAGKIGINFGGVQAKIDRTRELVRSILGFSQHEDFVKVLQGYVEQAVDNREFGLDVARYRLQKLPE